MKLWESGTVLHGYPAIVPSGERELEVPDGGVREYAAAGGYFTCICLEHRLTGEPDPRLIFVASSR